MQSSSDNCSHPRVEDNPIGWIQSIKFLETCDRSVYLCAYVHLNSPPVFSRVRDTRSIDLCICLKDRCLSFYPVSFGHRFVCSSSILGF